MVAHSVQFVQRRKTNSKIEEMDGLETIIMYKRNDPQFLDIKRQFLKEDVGLK